MIHRVLVGGTASGKKVVAAALHRRHGLRPLSMDSMKVYRGMDIGTDKPDPRVVAATGFGLLDLVGHAESFSAGRWVTAAVQAVEATDGPVLFAGGTPLYLRLLVRGVCPVPPGDPALRTELEARWDQLGEVAVRRELAAVDPELEQRLFPGDRKRIVRALEVQRLTGRPLSAWQREETRPPLPGRFVLAALRRTTPVHERRIRQRVERMFSDGLVAEVEGLLAAAPFAPEPARAIGYAEVLELLAGRLDRDAAIDRIVVRTRQLVRKQRTFLKSFPEIRWIDVAPDAEGEAISAAAEAALELGGPAA